MRATKPPPPPARKDHENARQRATHGPIRAPLIGQAKMGDPYAAPAPIPSGASAGGWGEGNPLGSGEPNLRVGVGVSHHPGVWVAGVLAGGCSSSLP